MDKNAAAETVKNMSTGDLQRMFASLSKGCTCLDCKQK
uniref:Uncharacterized protein n=1 Tax=viral metagenome TaxID=1070528 RepID=A0A6C0KBN6_9ZZZZ